jgi:hypothetical protein
MSGAGAVETALLSTLFAACHLARTQAAWLALCGGPPECLVAELAASRLALQGAVVAGNGILSAAVCQVLNQLFDEIAASAPLLGEPSAPPPPPSWPLPPRSAPRSAPLLGEPSAPPPPPSWPLPPRSAPRELNMLGDRLQFYWKHNTALICMRYFPMNEFINALTTIKLFPDVASQARYGSDQVGEWPKEHWDECKAVSGFWIRGMGRYSGRGFGVVGYGTNKKEHLRAVALAGAVAAAALSEPGLDWKQHGDMFPVLVKAVQLELGIESADPPAPAGFQLDVGGWDV